MKPVQKLLFASTVALIGFFLACSNDETSNTPLSTQQMAHEEGEDTTARELGFFNRKKSPYTDQNKALFERISKRHQFVEHFTVTQNGIFFLKQNRESVFNTSGKVHSKTRFALLDEQGNELLPMEYQTIGNPGFLGDGLIEIKKDNVFGIYDYINKKTIAPQFDVIFPSQIQEYIAIGNKNGQLFKIYADGKLKEIPADKAGPNYIELLKKFRFNYANDFYGMWYQTGVFNYFEEFKEYGEMQQATLIAPSYLNQLNIVPALYSGIIVNSDSLDFEPKQMRTKGNTVTMLSELYQYATESRGAEWKEHYISTFNSRNKVINTQLIFITGNYYHRYITKLGVPSVQFINDSLVEVKNFVENDPAGAMPYSWYTKYEYYSIASSGKITAINSGFFPMTGVIAINRNHFKGCFQSMLSDEQAMLQPNYDEDMEGMPMYCNTDHLSYADLELMKNEIYARHGKKFNDPKWASIFKAQKWYKPRSANVDALLTEIEKKNIEVINRMLKELKSNPKKFIHAETDFYVAAG